MKNGRLLRPVTYCGFIDLGFSELPYTWDNKRGGSNNVKARLDRVLVDGHMLDLYEDTSVHHIQMAKSDTRICGGDMRTKRQQSSRRGRMAATP